jgi:CspA family cold shock protein
MPTGIVKWFNEKKEYGFIHQDEGEDIFVHHTGINMAGFRVLHEGERVTYELGKGKKGPAAIDVTKV